MLVSSRPGQWVVHPNLIGYAVMVRVTIHCPYLFDVRQLLRWDTTRKDFFGASFDLSETPEAP